MTVTASGLRENVYKLLDRVLESGEPLEVKRRGKVLRVLPPDPVSKLARLGKRRCIKGDPEDLVHLDWLHEWKP